MGRRQRRACLHLRCLLLLPLFIVLLPSRILFQHQPEPPDTIFTDAFFWTGQPAEPWAQAMAVRNARIVHLGSDAHVQRVAGPATKVVRLGGRFVTPGFIDSHVHFIPGGLQMSHLDLRDVQTFHEFLLAVKSAAKEAPEGHWILGGGWDNDRWGGQLPNASWIDQVAPKNPVWLSRIDGHMGVANSVALALSNIHPHSPDPDGGRIVKDETGAPTGILVDSAMLLVSSPSRSATVENRRSALSNAIQAAWAKGVTSVVDFGAVLPGVTSMQAWEDLEEVYMWADSKGTLGVRVSVFLPLDTWAAVAAMVGEKGYRLSEWLRIGGVKAFADGSLGSRSALFYESYEDDPGNFGLRLSDPNQLFESVVKADAHGLQVAVHAIGDAANDEVLSIYATTNLINGPRDRRFRIEHAQHLSTEAPLKFVASGVIASMQPYHMLDDMVRAEKSLGKDRATRGSFLLASLVGNGTHVALGSDWTVAPLNPLTGMQAATTRSAAGWPAPWVPSQCITEEAALMGYTSGAAYAAFTDEDVGTLAVGKYADFVVLSRSPLTKSSDEVLVTATYIGGSLRYWTEDQPAVPLDATPKAPKDADDGR